MPTTELPTLHIPFVPASEEEEEECSDSDCEDHSHAGSEGSGGAGASFNTDPNTACYVLNINFGNEELESLHRAVLAVPSCACPLMEAVARAGPGAVLSMATLQALVPRRSALVLKIVEALVHHGALTKSQ